LRIEPFSRWTLPLLDKRREAKFLGRSPTRSTSSSAVSNPAFRLVIAAGLLAVMSMVYSAVPTTSNRYGRSSSVN
jgi:hypothetical protein